MNSRGKKRILVIEDERHIAEGLKLNLALQGYDVMIAENGNAGLQTWKSWRPDLVVLDIMLPGIDGLSVLQSIRLDDERIPILILSAKAATDYKIKGLSYGVDDYLTKPFSLAEFLLRVERLLKRSAWYEDSLTGQGNSVDPEQNIHTFGDNRIDFSTLVAKGPKGEIQLTEQEARLLKLFVSNQGTPLSRQKLLEIGWGYTRGTSSRTLDNFIVRFRKYFEKNPKKPVHFKSLRSIGYVFHADPENL
jgi:DNA-binding response OmpR family regulator